MKRTVTKYDFIEAFSKMGREDQFSSEALELIFKWVEDCEVQTDTESELDVIAICCDISEETWEDIADNYGIDTSDCENEEEAKKEVENYLLEETALIGETKDGFVYVMF